MNYTPMLAGIGTLEDLKREGYIYEPKMDGTRALCYKSASEISFINRRGRNITDRYPEFQFADNISAETCVLDGEIIIYNEKGNPDFQLLQQREQLTRQRRISMQSLAYPATYVVFDILSKDGRDLCSLPLLERKKILEEMITENKRIQTMYYTVDGASLWSIVAERELEGIIAKRAESRYSPGRRLDYWLKIKSFKTVDCVVVGYLQKQRNLSSIALALYDEGRLRHVGNVGTGLSEKYLEALKQVLDAIRVEQPPLELPAGIIPVEPKHVAEVKYLEFTNDRKLRIPVFLRLRTDKPLEECVFPTKDHAGYRNV